MPTQVLSIQYLRAIAALLVVVTHILLKLKQLGYTQFENTNFDGGIGIDIFFIVSGYVMCLTTSRSKFGNPTTAINFLKRRIFRIFPMYWALTLIAYFIYLIAPDHVNAGGGQTQIFDSFLLIPTEGKYLVKNGWTLTYEIYFYLVFTLSLLVRKPWALWILFTVIAIPVLLGSLQAVHNPWLIVVTNNITIEFLMGVILYYVHKHSYGSGTINSPYSGIVLILGSMAYLYSTGFSYSEGSRFIDFGVPAFAFCLGFLFFESFIEKKNYSLPLLIGDSSYSLYLIHPFVLAALRFVFEALDSRNNSMMFFTFVIMLITSCLAGFISYVLFEDTAAKYLKRKPFREYLIFRYFHQVKIF